MNKVRAIAAASFLALGACGDSSKVEVVVVERRDDNYFQKPGCEVKLTVNNNDTVELRIMEFVLTGGKGRTSATGSSMQVSSESSGRASAYFADAKCASLPPKFGIEILRCSLRDGRNCADSVRLRH